MPVVFQIRTGDKVIPVNTNQTFISFFDPYPVAVTYENKSFYIGSQDINPQGIFFQPDGSRMFMIGAANDRVYSYSLSTPWDISTATYESKNFYVGSQDSVPTGIFFKPDGSRMFMVGNANDRVYSYSLSTPWDISTATYENKSFHVGSQDNTPSGIFFKPDGSRMFVIGTTNDRVYSYSLSTPWDISTASYENKSFPMNSQEGSPSGIFFKPDGSRMFVIGTTNDRVYSYSLSTPWDISTATYENKNFYVGSQDSGPTGIFFKPDGSRMFVIGDTNDRVYSYSLSTPWIIEKHSLFYEGKNFYVGSQDSDPTRIFFKPDGSRMFVVGITNDRVYSYSLSTPWDISTATYESKYFSVSSQDSGPTGIFFKPDGSRMFVIGESSDKVYSYSLSTPWDISTATYESKNFYVGSQDSGPTGIFFKPDGSRMFMVGNANDRVYSYSLSTPWDISTASYENKNFYIGYQETSSTGIFFQPNGSRMFVVGYGTNRVYSYSLSTPWDISTATYENKSFHVGSQDNTPLGIFFKPDGSRMFMVGNFNDRVYSYILKP